MPGPGIILQVLASPAAQKIDFHLGTIHVDGAGFREVMGSLVARMARFRGIGTRSEAQPAGAGATYSTSENMLSFPADATFGTTPTDRMYIVHESVHAMQDLTGDRWFSERGSILTTETENEAAAYIAGFLYSLYDVGTPIYTNTPISRVGYAIAGTIRNKKGAVISRADSDALQDAVAKTPIYANDGITRGTRTFSDGV